MDSTQLFLTDEIGYTVIKAYRSSHAPQSKPRQLHRHAECELSIFLQGKGIFALADKQCPFSPGDIFLFGPDQLHNLAQIDEETDLLVFHFEPLILLENRECQRILDLLVSKKFQNHIPAGDRVLAEKLLNLEQEMTHQQIGCVTNGKFLLLSALFHILREYHTHKQVPPQTGTPTPSQNMHTVMSYINQNLSKSLSLQELAQVAHLTPTYFSATFKKLTGLSPWKYITVKRVELAVHLLRSENITKQEIAQRCGFSSMSNFYSAFTSVTGKTPSDFL